LIPNKQLAAPNPHLQYSHATALQLPAILHSKLHFAYDLSCASLSLKSLEAAAMMSSVGCRSALRTFCLARSKKISGARALSLATFMHLPQTKSHQHCNAASNIPQAATSSQQRFTAARPRMRRQL